jgi:hypothetical protein
VLRLVCILLHRQQGFYFVQYFTCIGDGLPYCVKCGAPLKESDKFCTVCGTPAAKFTRNEYTVSGKNLVDRIGEILHEGNVTRVIVKDDAGKTLLEIPATIGVVGVVLAPWLAALGVIAALVSNCKIVVERRE